MKTKHLKLLIKEIVVRALREAKIQDPTKQEMMSYLQQQYGREDGWKDEAEVAIYWFANFYHGGQWSNLYSALSTSQFSPGPIAKGPQKDSMEEMMYKDLVYQFAGGEGLDDEEEVQEVLAGQPKKFTVRFVILGREPTEDTFNSREEAIRAARDFIKSVVTPGAKRAGEHVEGVKNGYIVRHVDGGTRAAAIIQGENMFQENTMNFDVNTYKLLKKEYEKAVKLGRPSFTLNGQEILVSYAKYLLQYLAPKFGGIKENDVAGQPNLIDGQSNIVAASRVNKVLGELSKGMFSDGSWETINKIFSKLKQLGLDVELLDAKYGGHADSQHGMPTFKEWKISIPFTNNKGRPTNLVGQITAHGAGSVEQPLDRYDVTAYVTAIAGK